MDASFGRPNVHVHAHVTKPLLGKPVSDCDLLFSRRHARRVVRRLCQLSPRRAAVLPALAVVGNLSAWAREHHAKLVHAFVTRTQASALALVPLGRDAEAIGFAWLR
jgi:hypothetical protein